MKNNEKASAVLLALGVLWVASAQAGESPGSLNGVLCESAEAVQEWNDYLVARQDDPLEAALRDFNSSGRAKKCHEFRGIVVSLKRHASFVRSDTAIVDVLELTLLSLPTSTFYTYEIRREAGAAI